MRIIHPGAGPATVERPQSPMWWLACTVVHNYQFLQQGKIKILKIMCELIFSRDRDYLRKSTYH